VTSAPAIGESASSVKPVLTARIPWVPFAFLALTAAIAVAWSAAKLLWWDEFLVLWTDHQPGWAQVAQIQLHWPVSLDPLVYHCLANTAMRLLGPGAFAIRLPALLGFLVMQFCLYLFMRHLISQKAAVLALVFPALTAALYYAVEGRPYGLLLGLCGIAMVSWQAAVHRETRRAPVRSSPSRCLLASPSTPTITAGFCSFPFLRRRSFAPSGVGVWTSPSWPRWPPHRRLLSSSCPSPGLRRHSATTTTSSPRTG